MDNKEKAQRISDALRHYTASEREHALMYGIIKDELNRIDAPEPKKWEPRGGEWLVDADGEIERQGGGNDTYRLAGREYPTREEAERAAPLHRKLDRLVNWLVEHCNSRTIDVEIWQNFKDNGMATVVFSGTDSYGLSLYEVINSGEVEL